MFFYRSRGPFFPDPFNYTEEEEKETREARQPHATGNTWKQFGLFGPIVDVRMLNPLTISQFSLMDFFFLFYSLLPSK